MKHKNGKYTQGRQRDWASLRKKRRVRWSVVPKGGFPFAETKDGTVAWISYLADTFGDGAELLFGHDKRHCTAGEVLTTQSLQC